MSEKKFNLEATVTRHPRWEDSREYPIYNVEIRYLQNEINTTYNYAIALQEDMGCEFFPADFDNDEDAEDGFGPWTHFAYDIPEDKREEYAASIAFQLFVQQGVV